MSDRQHHRVQLPSGLTLYGDEAKSVIDIIRERDAALARIAAVEALHFAHGRNILGKPVCAECSPLQPMPCPTLRALAASPTPTGPETAHYSVWRPRDDEEIEVCAVCSPKHTPEERWQLWPCGPATPEPTEETP